MAGNSFAYMKPSSQIRIKTLLDGHQMRLYKKTNNDLYQLQSRTPNLPQDSIYPWVDDALKGN